MIFIKISKDNNMMPIWKWLITSNDGDTTGHIPDLIEMLPRYKDSDNLQLIKDHDNKYTLYSITEYGRPLPSDLSHIEDVPSWIRQTYKREHSKLPRTSE